MPPPTESDQAAARAEGWDGLLWIERGATDRFEPPESPECPGEKILREVEARLGFWWRSGL